MSAAPPVVPPPVPSVVAAMGSGLAPAPPLAVSGSALLSSASDPIVVGSRVTVVGDARELRAMIDSHVSVAWTDELARYVGVVGTVSMVDTDDSASVKRGGEDLLLSSQLGLPRHGGGADWLTGCACLLSVLCAAASWTARASGSRCRRCGP